MFEGLQIVNKGLCSLDFVREVNEDTDNTIVDKIFIVKEFSYVFSENLSSFPNQEENQFCINLMQGTKTISTSPYHISLVELKMLKIQLHDLLDEGNICIVFPVAVNLLLVWKKDESLLLCISYHKENKVLKISLGNYSTFW